jgi:hypothetical protein
MTNGCNWFEPSGIRNQLNFYPNQIELLSLSVKSKSDSLKHIINTNFCGLLPDKFHKIVMTYVMQLQKYTKQIFRTTPHGCRQILIQIKV